MQIQRRSAKRKSIRNERVAWGDADGGPLSSGHVGDISTSGILIAVPAQMPLDTGSDIRVLSRRLRMTRRARIVRVEDVRVDDAPFKRIGCRWITLRDRRRQVKQMRHRIDHAPLPLASPQREEVPHDAR